MLELWKKIANYGHKDSMDDSDGRNLRLMNSMSFILLICMLIFSVLSLTFENAEEVPFLIGAAVAFSLNFLLIRNSTFTVTKLYFTLLSPVMVSYFAVAAVGTAGTDKWYLLCTAIIPLVIFKKKKHYLPIVLFNLAAFFTVEHLQMIIPPRTTLAPEALEVYLATNVITMFLIIYATLHIFKKEIFGYQRKIEDQKDLIAAKSKEVTESIEYAKNIQNAILPPLDMLSKNLPNSFILYKPKDIVAGDFYWMETVSDLVLFACADCTGHGVPGAMVSVVCHNALNRSVKEFGLTDPGKILNKTRELVVETFEKSHHKVKDGMDISLCTYDRNKNQLEFAGANNGIYHLRGDVLEEYKGDKEPIGYYQNPSPFSTICLELQTGDSIYLTTDGFPDQFGGEKGKKYKYKPFRDFLMKLRNERIETQEEVLHKEFERWRGEFEQVDDVCVIGVNF